MDIVHNQYFSAGAGLVILTACGSFGLKSFNKLADFTKRKLLVSVELNSKDSSHSWFLDWLAKHNKNMIDFNSNSLNNTSKIGRVLQKLHNLSVETTVNRLSNGSILTNISLVPGQGTHFFKYKNGWFKVDRTRGKMSDLTTGTPWETITITTLSKHCYLFLNILNEAKGLALSKHVGKMIVYTCFGHEWRPFGLPRTRRSLSSVVLDGDSAKKLVDDVVLFLASADWYAQRGIPFRRGYLLYGPPGTGKSSFIQALAGHLEYSICIMTLSEIGMTDDRFAHLLNNVPPRTIILLEDIDAAFSPRTLKENSKHNTGLTLSGLLNGLDGVVASEERIIFMTTNHPQLLDPAITRPGRVDYSLKLGFFY
jgi:chaperone BCS1